MERKDVIIIGGGPAGLAAAVRLFDKGITNILIIEREKHLGGILRQCIHDGFGLKRFKETLSGPEYAQRFIDEVEERQIPYVTDTTVIGLTSDKQVTAVSAAGLKVYQARAIVLAMGCRERTRHALSIPGSRPAGIYTAGVAQTYVNLLNIMPGKEVIILGSGDIGLIMARRMTLEGAKVKGVFEIQPYPSGLPRNIEQCLHDYDIDLHLSHTVVDIKGTSRLESVTIARVDEYFTPIPGTEKEYTCDTLILSVGLIPENELSLAAGVQLDPRTRGALVNNHYETNIDGIFAAGNVLQVHDLVDYVSMESERLANAATQYINGDTFPDARPVPIKTDQYISHTIPQTVEGSDPFILSMRVRRPYRNCEIHITSGGHVLKKLRLKKALPAEMIQTTVDPGQVNTIRELEVSVVCSEK